VWILDKDNKVAERPVSVGPWHGDDWFITEGVQTGERVVVDGTFTLSAGAQVEAVPYTPKPAPTPAATMPAPAAPAQAAKK
jgi:membrane fusion protein (multidrug efflux system)